MTDSNEGVNSHSNKNPQKIKSLVVAEPANDQFDQITLREDKSIANFGTPPAPSNDAINFKVLSNGSLESQVNLLSNSNISAIQRQTIATQIGHIQGNHHLQRVIAEVDQSKKEQSMTLTKTPSSQIVVQRQGKVKEIDEMLANLETAFRVRIPQMDNKELINEANKLNDKLFLPKSEVGPKQKSAIAETLILMHKTMDMRIQNAPYDNKMMPKLKGIRWKPNDPLAGIVEGISPFHMIDWWDGFVVAKKRVPTKRKHTATSEARPQQVKTRQSGGTKEKQPQRQPPPGTRGVIGKEFGKPKKFGPNLETWWKNIGLGLSKAVRMMAANWINALRAGVEKSARRYCKFVVAEGIASMAVNIADDAISQIVDPDTGLRIFVYGKIPEPTDRRIVPALKAMMKQWEYPSDRIALNLGRKRGLTIARNIINTLETKYSGGGVRYLLYLKQKFKGNQQAIYAYIYKELKKAGVR